jgi:rhodanese-related sulfurtransferase
MARNGSEKTVVGADEARELVASGEATVFDLRDEEEFGSGHIAGATQVDEDAIDEELAQLEEDRRVLVVCGEGKRSAKVAERLREQGRDATSMKGGMKAWAGPEQPPESDIEFEGPGDTRPGV